MKIFFQKYHQDNVRYEIESNYSNDMLQNVSGIRFGRQIITITSSWMTNPYEIFNNILSIPPSIDALIEIMAPAQLSNYIIIFEKGLKKCTNVQNTTKAS